MVVVSNELATSTMRKHYKYKREHFDTQQEYDRFKSRINKAQKRWLEKSESLNPEKRERRLLRQCLYSRYYWHSDGRQSFADWLQKEYGISDIKPLSLDELRRKVSKG